MKITEINRESLKMLRDKIEAALQEIAKEHDVAISVGGASFTSNNARFKLDVATKGDGGEVNDRDAETFKHLAFTIGLKPEDLGKTFTYGGVTYKIIGMKPKSYRFPIIAENTNTKRRVKCPVEMVKAGLK